jgi:multiple sugar transport system ATP-binding protein
LENAAVSDVFVSIRDLQVSFGPVSVLDGLDLEVDRGEFIVLLGPSGCGKSTLLSAIAGLTEIADGEIWIADRNVTWNDPKDRGIGMVFQTYALYPRMTVEKNLSFALRVAGLPRDEIERRVQATAKLLHLDPLLKRRPAELSGGQRQRVAIGRALVRNVDVFLFDEPLSNLDAKLRAELRVEIKKLHQQLGNTMIYVTHDQIEALTLADRIAVMKEGVIQQFASPFEIYHQPANLFVATFLGAPPMNLLPGRVDFRSDKVGMFCGQEWIALDRYPNASQLSLGQNIIMGVRPETVAVGTFLDHYCTRHAKISLVEPMGAETVIWTDFAGNQFTAGLDGKSTIKAGDSVTLGFDVADASIFDQLSERRV